MNTPFPGPPGTPSEMSQKITHITCMSESIRPLPYGWLPVTRLTLEGVPLVEGRGTVTGNRFDAQLVGRIATAPALATTQGGQSWAK